MTSDGGWPLVRRAPLRILRSGVLAGMILAAVALLAGLVAAGPLYQAATDAGGLSRELAAIPPGTLPGQQAQFQITQYAAPTPEDEPAVTHLVDSVPYLGDPVTSISADSYELDEDHPLPYVEVGGRILPAVPYFRTGALPALQVVSGRPGTPGLWLPEQQAADLHARAGSRILVGKTYYSPGCGAPIHESNLTAKDPPSVGAVVAGVYRTRGNHLTPAGGYWTPITSQLPSDPAGCPGPAALLIGERSTISGLLEATVDLRLWTHSATLSAAGRTPAHLKVAAAAVGRITLQANQPGTPIANRLGGTGAGYYLAGLGAVPFRIDSGLPALEEQAVADARAAAQQGRGIAYAGAVLGLAAVVIALRALAQRRRRETELLLSLGTPVWVVVATAALELVLPAVAGAAAGWGVSVLAVIRFGPQPELGSAALLRSGVAAALVALVALLANSAVVLGQVLQVRRELSGRPATRLGSQWLPVLTGMTVLAVVATLGRSGRETFRDPIAPLLPILVLTCGCALLVRIVAGLVDAVRGARPDPVAAGASTRGTAGATGRPEGGTGRAGGGRATDRLILRGLRRTGVAVTDLVVVLGIGIGVLGYGLVSSSLVHQAVAAKAAVLAGADSRAQIVSSGALNAGSGPNLRLPPGESVLWRAPGALNPDTQDLDVLVVNPQNFGSAALFGPGRELAAARAALGVFSAPLAAGAPVPALLVGPSLRPVGSTAQLVVGTATTAVAVRGHLTAFPGATRPTLVLDARTYFARLPAIDDPTHRVIATFDSPTDYTTWVWSTASLPALRRSLDAKNVAVSATGSLAQARATPVLTSSGWASAYQVTLGVAAALLAGLAIVVAVDRRVARAAPADLVMRRFGVGASRLLRLRTRELAATGLGALAALALPLLGMVLLVPRLLEPDPDLQPLLTVHWTPVALLLTVLAALAVTALAALAAARRSASIDAGEVLRDDF